MSQPDSNKVVFKKRGSTFRRNERKCEETSSSEDETKAIKVSRKQNSTNKLVQRSSGYNKRKNLEIESDSDEELTVAFKSKRSSIREGPSDMGATSYVQTETEKDRDAQAIFERSLIVDKESRGKADDKVYKGLNNYSKFYEKKDTAQGNAASGSVRKGPIRAPDHIRSTVRWDYQPDLCKDFKETGFCGFGDSCKFLHDRTDYKFGWQLEVDSRKKNGDDDEEENYEIPSDEEHIPFKCLFCRKSFEDPVVTKCRHFFCEKCAIECFRKSKNCYVCGVNTHGVFKPAKEISDRLAQENYHDEEDSDD